MLKGIAIKILPGIFAFLISNHSYSQKKQDSFYLFDVNWKPVAIEKATFLVRIQKINDTSYSGLTYLLYGPRISDETYLDEQGTTRHGKSIYYHPTGFRDSAGQFMRGIVNGEWHYWNPKGNHVRKKTFENGKLLSDSITPIKTDTPTVKQNPVPGEVESSFPGGAGSWVKFLNKNFNYPQRAVAANIQGTVVLQFIVDKDGTVIEPEIIKSVEYSLDEEALRIIKKSAKWEPAIQDGKVVKSYKAQPITFHL